MSEKRINILIADDYENIRELLRTIVREEGHNSYVASNGLEAIELMRKVHLSLVFIDFKMPEMDGFELIEQSRKLVAGTKLVAMTEYSGELVRRISYICSKNLVKCIRKPFDLDHIREIIREKARCSM